MKRVLSLIVTILSVGLTSCVSVDDHHRDLDLSRDLVPGDLAHLRRHVPDADGGEVQSSMVGLPLLFVPAFLTTSEVVADRVEDGGYHYHAEDDLLLGLVAGHNFEETKYDDGGRILRRKENGGLLLGLLMRWEESRWHAADGTEHRREEGSLLSGLLFKRVEEDGKVDSNFLLIPLSDEIDD